jgi:hypothetical protein
MDIKNKINMEKINFRKIGILLTFVLILNSCEKWIDPEINVSPNSPADVTLNLLLPSSQAGVAYVFGGDHSRFSGMWMQHLSGVDRQSFASERYSVLESDADNLWNTLYGGVLKNLVIMVDKAQAQEAFTYEALAKIHIAYTLALLTDVWGDAPYSDALRGETGNLTPLFDTQEQLYGTINTYLDEAVALLGQESPAGVPVPGSDDLFYGGENEKAQWMKVAKALKVRYALHLSKRNGYEPVRSLINAGGLMESPADDWYFQFTNNANEWNPRYQFDSDRGDIRVGAKIVDMMLATDDPRIPVYFASTNDTVFTVVGSGPGEANVDASFVGPGYAGQAAPVPFFTYYEQKFIEAEAFVGNDNARAAAAYSEGIKASLETHGVFDQDWFDANSTLDTSLEDDAILAQIMDAKYVAMFLHSETWVDWRRTGYPELTPALNAVSAIPRRYLYTVDEINYNGDNVPQGLTSTSRVWWDVE